jgi:prephenate dehydratase
VIKKIGYLGPPGTFTELATRSYLEKIAAGNGGESFEAVCFYSLADILSAVEAGELEEGILPLENSTEGPVNQTLDLLAHRFKQVKIKAEVILPVIHQLLAHAVVGLGEVAAVVSHPQALAQCRGFIERFLPRAEIREVISTAEAARIVAREAAPWAAIGTALVAGSYGLTVLAEDVNDYPDNATRFVVVALEDGAHLPGCKTSIILSVKDRPGALYDILKEFAQSGINLTRIESRPAKSRLGDYLFFIDLEGHHRDFLVRQALLAISEHTVSMRLLGSYPVRGTGGRQEPAPELPVSSLLKQLRDEIDQVDGRIVELLGKRTRIVKRVGKLKPYPMQVRDQEREKEIIHHVRFLARKEGVDEQVVENIYRLLLDHFVSLQTSVMKL